MKKKHIVPAAALLAVAAGGFGIAQFAAADPSPTPSATSSAKPGDGTGSSGKVGRHRRGGEGAFGMRTADLANKLGSDEATIKTAAKAAFEKTRDSFKSSGTRPDRDAMADKFAEALASELGIDKAKVTAAINELQATHKAEAKAAFKNRLSQAVKDGKLTQTEADAVLKAADAGVIGMGGGPR